MVEGSKYDADGKKQKKVFSTKKIIATLREKKKLPKTIRTKVKWVSELLLRFGRAPRS